MSTSFWLGNDLSLRLIMEIDTSKNVEVVYLNARNLSIVSSRIFVIFLASVKQMLLLFLLFSCWRWKIDRWQENELDCCSDSINRHHSLWNWSWQWWLIRRFVFNESLQVQEHAVVFFLSMVKVMSWIYVRKKHCLNEEWVSVVIICLKWSFGRDPMKKSLRSRLLADLIISSLSE